MLMRFVRSAGEAIRVDRAMGVISATVLCFQALNRAMLLMYALHKFQH